MDARERRMKRNRYKEWILVWEWFAFIKIKEVVPRENWNVLYDLLNDLWQEERKDASPEELAAHSAATNVLKQ
jgi:hypothetical protein